MTKPLTCIILGGKGFVGSAIAAEARTRGHDVLIVDKEEYDSAVGARCDVLINANGNSKKFLAREQPKLEFDLSVRSVLHSLHDFSAERYIHLSTMDVYPDVSDPALNHEDVVIDIARQSPYGFHKFMAEQIVRHYAPQWIIFRMAGFVGPGIWKNSIFDLLNNRPLRVHPDSEYQYLNTADLARLLFTVIEGGISKEIFNVAGEGLMSLRDIAALIQNCTIDPAWATLPRERYDLNVAKLARRATIPRTTETVGTFVRAWRGQA